MKRFKTTQAKQIDAQRKKHDDANRRLMTARRIEKRKADIKAMLRHLPEFSSVLCVGARDDSEVNEFLKLSFNAQGIDVATESRLIIRCDAHQLDKFFREDQFDVVYCADAIEHMYDPGVVLAQIRRVARIGCFINVPLYDGAVEPDINHCSIFSIMEHGLGYCAWPTNEQLAEFDALRPFELLHYEGIRDVHDGAGVGSFIFKF